MTAHICARCDNLHDPDRHQPCPCIRGEILLRRARADVNRRHRASVKAAAVSARLTARRAA